MSFQITTKFELNIQKSDSTDAGAAGNLAVRNKIPAIVCNPMQFMPVVVDRVSKQVGHIQPRFKIIVAIDFENSGKKYALDKIHHLPTDILSADGFDVLLTPGVSDIQTANEMKAIREFLRTINNLVEVRWTVSSLNWDKERIQSILKHVGKNPCNFIRTEPNADTPHEIDHATHIENIKEIINTPIKLSGNVTYETYKKFISKVSRFDVTVSQLRSILNDIKNETFESAEAEQQKRDEATAKKAEEEAAAAAEKAEEAAAAAAKEN